MSQTAQRLHEIARLLDEVDQTTLTGAADDLRLIARNLASEFQRGYNTREAELVARSNLSTETEAEAARANALLLEMSNVEPKKLPPRKKQEAKSDLSLDDLDL